MLLLTGAGCSEPAGISSALGQRFIDADPEVIFRPEELIDVRASFRWNLDDPVEASRWTGARGDPSDDGRGLPLAGRRGPVLVRAMENRLRAETVQRLVVKVTGLGSAPLRLLWTRHGERLSSGRSLQTTATPGSPETFTFALGSDPSWSGQVERIALDSPKARLKGARVLEVLGQEVLVQEDALRGALLRPWKVDLWGDLRNAFLAPPGSPIAREVELAPGSKLRFGIGATGQLRKPVVFRAFLHREGSEPLELSGDRLSGRSDAGWSEVEVDLDGIGAEGTARIVLETEAEAPLDLAEAIPVISNPRLVRPATVQDTESVNVVLISIDTLRADRLSVAGYERATTPHLDQWAERSAIVFDNAVAQAPWTLPSHVSMLTGLDALAHGVNYRSDSAPADLDFVAECFRRAGYATAAFTAGGFVAPEFGLTQGFDRYQSHVLRSPRKLRRIFHSELERSIDQLARWLRHDATRPFFAFFHTYEVHHPYHAREPWFGRFGGDSRSLARDFPAQRELPLEPETLVTRTKLVHPSARNGQEDPRSLTAEELVEVNRLYDSGVAYINQEVGKLFDTLQTLGLDRNTVVVFTSDHGEALGEHQLAAHTHLYDDTLRIPLIIGAPQPIHGGRRVEDQVRSIDIVPTILALAGIPPPADLDGASLVDLMEGRAEPRRREAWSYAAYTNVGVALRLGNGLKFIRPNAVWPGLVGRAELYDLMRDPSELRNLADTHPALRRLEARVSERLRRDLPGVRLSLSNSEQVPLSGEIRGALIQANTVSSPDLDCRCVEWLGRSRIRYRVPPGAVYTLVLERAAESTLAVEGRLGKEASRLRVFEFEVDLETLSGPFAYGWSGTGWGPLEPTDSIATGIVIEGETAIRPSRGPGRSSEVLERLRALGYVP